MLANLWKLPLPLFFVPYARATLSRNQLGMECADIILKQSETETSSFLDFYLLQPLPV